LLDITTAGESLENYAMKRSERSTAFDQEVNCCIIGYTQTPKHVNRA